MPTLREAVDMLFANPWKKALVMEDRLFYYDPTLDPGGLTVAMRNGNPLQEDDVACFGYGVSVFSLKDAFSCSHVVVDVDFHPHHTGRDYDKLVAMGKVAFARLADGVHAAIAKHLELFPDEPLCSFCEGHGCGLCDGAGVVDSHQDRRS